MHNWKTAGRPKKIGAHSQVCETTEEKDWTKEELSILSATERGGYIMLAIAVIKQWQKDGKPKKDKEAIKYWLNILKQTMRM